MCERQQVPLLLLVIVFMVLAPAQVPMVVLAVDWRMLLVVGLMVR